MNHLKCSLIAIYFAINFSVNTTVNAQLSTRILTISANTTEEFAIYDNESPPEDWVRFITIGLHSQKHNLTLFKSNETNTSQVSGHNIGLVLMTAEDNGYIFITNNNSYDVNALLTTSQNDDMRPVPGGCNEEFALKISPFLKLYDSPFTNQLDYQLANIGSPKGFKPIECEKSQFLIKYEVYAYFLNENDFSEEEYFRAITLMSNISDMTDSASLLTSLNDTRLYFYSYPGRGIVYNIMVSSENYSSLYVPIVTYDCNDLNDCVSHNIYGLIMAVVFGVIGFIVCLRGHFWFQTQVLFFGLIDGSFIAYILLTKYTNLSETQTSIYTLVIGIAFAFVWLFVWKILHIPGLSLQLTGLSLGFLLISTVLFTTIGNLDVFHNDMNYWLIMCCTSLLVTLFFLMVNAIVLSVVSSSIVGSYVAVVAIDRFVDGSLSFIVLNVVKRALFHYTAFNTVPFQNKDIVLSLLWILLSLTGIVLQMHNSNDRNRSPFPAPTSCSHPHRERRLSRRALYEIQDHRNSIRQPRNRRWSPVPSASQNGQQNRVVDERSSLLYPNFNINTSLSERLPRRSSPPPDYDFVASPNQRQYLSI